MSRLPLVKRTEIVSASGLLAPGSALVAAHGVAQNADHKLRLHLKPKRTAEAAEEICRIAGQAHASTRVN